jgi:acyl carrier protein
VTTMTERIVKLLAERCDLTAEAMTAATTLSALDLDSLTLLEVTLRVEQEFGTALEPEDLLQAETIGDLARVVELHLTA